MSLLMPLTYRKLILPFILIGSISAIGTQFLAIPNSASELALGGQAGMQVESMVNPASAQKSGPGMELNISLGNWLGGVKASFVSVGFDALSGTGQVGFRYFGLDDLEYRDERPMDQPMATYGANGIALDGGWAGSIGVSKIGIAVHLIRMQMHTESSTGIGLDLGGVGRINRAITIGAALLNMGTMNALMASSPQLPFRLLIGGGYMIDHPRIPTEIGLTGEWSALRGNMILSIGSHSTWKMMHWSFGTKLAPEVVVASAGFGLTLGRYAIRYGIQFGSQQVGLPQLIDLAVQLP
ncbi:MAG: hypothetical protein H8E14_15915 [Candidatus Marinimicrobia bacterium]|nr:hypothetical protein [Candidatus Neomarinimicrobiota bacterium]